MSNQCNVSCHFGKALSLIQHEERDVIVASEADEEMGPRTAPAPLAPNKILRSYTRRNLIRVYPRGTRLLSSNMDPLPFWRSGCQMVALNYQAKDRPLLLNRALFRQNGRCGYVLKPRGLCGESFGDAPSLVHRICKGDLSLFRPERCHRPADERLQSPVGDDHKRPAPAEIGGADDEGRRHRALRQASNHRAPLRRGGMRHQSCA